MGRKPNHGGHGGGGSTPPPPPAPTGLTVTDTNNTAVLSWNAVTNAQGYWIYRYDYVVAIVQATTFTDTTVAVGSTYTYAVAAVVNTVLGPRSSSVTITIT